jgi:4-carboxymuconolactone decarboxylase
MHLSRPRIAALTDAELTSEQREAVARATQPGSPPLNIFRTLVQVPEALRGFMAWATYILAGNSLSTRQRETVILRIAFLSRSAYVWSHHVRLGRDAGLSEVDVLALKAGADAPSWSPADAALVRACDDLHTYQFVSNETWSALKAHFNDRQFMDIVFTAGQYLQTCMMMNSFGVQLDEGHHLDPDLTPPTAV